MNTISAIYNFSSPDKLAEGLVVREGVVVFLRKDVVNVFHAPCLQQLGGAFGLTRECRFGEKKSKREITLSRYLLGTYRLYLLSLSGLVTWQSSSSSSSSSGSGSLRLLLELDEPPFSATAPPFFLSLAELERFFFFLPGA